MILWGNTADVGCRRVAAGEEPTRFLNHRMRPGSSLGPTGQIACSVSNSHSYGLNHSLNSLLLAEHTLTPQKATSLAPLPSHRLDGGRVGQREALKIGTGLGPWVGKWG